MTMVLVVDTLIWKDGVATIAISLTSLATAALRESIMGSFPQGAHCP